MSKTVLAIDIGSTKICAIIAEVSDDNSIAITGAGTAKAQGLKKGSITNIELASKSIKSALNDAKRVSGSDVKSAIVGREPQRANLVYSDGGRIKRKEILADPFGYKRSPIARWECLIADEDKRVKYGEPTVVKIKKVEVPKNIIVYPL